MEALTEATDEVEEGLLSDFTQQCLRDGLAFALKEGENERQKFLDKLPKVPSFKPIRDTLKATRKDHEDILAGKEDEYKQALQTAHLIAVAKASGANQPSRRVTQLQDSSESATTTDPRTHSAPDLAENGCQADAARSHMEVDDPVELGPQRH
ncbi:hypothetical protein GGI05_003762 [Coemansia sp. RSA 2603]|nr:hypothetical protein GGI05_003762 [Coemansia sp. RSA 2603]